MSGAAKVTAIDAVAAVATALRCFQEEALAALDELQMEVNRALDWIKNDRTNYWREAVRRGFDEVAEAKTQLEQARSARRIADYEPTCREEQKALERAQRRLQVAQEKVEAVRHWCYAIEKAVIEYRGNVGHLGRWLEADLPRALAALQHMITALDAYVAAAAPEVTLADLSAAAANETASMSRGEDEQPTTTTPPDGQAETSADAVEATAQPGEEQS